MGTMKQKIGFFQKLVPAPAITLAAAEDGKYQRADGAAGAQQNKAETGCESFAILHSFHSLSI